MHDTNMKIIMDSGVFIEPLINVKFFIPVFRVVHDGFIEKYDVLSYFV